MPPRNRILLEQHQRIIQAFEDVNEDYLMVAATIGVNRSMARSIIARYLWEGRITERPQGGTNHVWVDDEMKNCLDDILNKICLLTLAQINQELRQRVPRNPWLYSNQNTWRYIVSWEIGKPIPVERNHPYVLQKRLVCANWFMCYAVVNHSIFIDKCS